MNWKKLIRPGALVATAALAIGMAAPSPGGGVEVGERVSYTFRDSVLNARGLTKLEGLRGKPVIVEFWGTR